MKNKSVYVIILNYNHREELKETINAFKNQDYPELRLVVSDNASEDDSVHWLKENHPELTILENKENLGWAGGNNVGIEYALKNNADYILLANNDLYFDNEKLVSELVNDLELLKNQNVGIIGTRVFYHNPKNKLHNIGWTTEFKGIPFNTNRADYENKFSMNNKYKVVDYVSGCFMLIDSKVFQKNGLIDESFFIYGEESDFSFRAWKKGIASVINTDLYIYHKIAATNKVGSPLSSYLKTRNLFYLLNKHKKDITHYKFYKYKHTKNFLKNIYNALFSPKKFNGPYFKVIKSLLQGYYDGINNKMGKPYKYLNKK